MDLKDWDKVCDFAFLVRCEYGQYYTRDPHWECYQERPAESPYSAQEDYREGALHRHKIEPLLYMISAMVPKAKKQEFIADREMLWEKPLSDKYRCDGTKTIVTHQRFLFGALTKTVVPKGAMYYKINYEKTLVAIVRSDIKNIHFIGYGEG